MNCNDVRLCLTDYATVLDQQVEGFVRLHWPPVGTVHRCRAGLDPEQMDRLRARSPCVLHLGRLSILTCGSVRFSIIHPCINTSYTYWVAARRPSLHSPVESAHGEPRVLKPVGAPLWIVLCAANHRSPPIYSLSPQTFYNTLPFSRDLHERSSVVCPCTGCLCATRRPHVVSEPGMFDRVDIFLVHEEIKLHLTL